MPKDMRRVETCPAMGCEFCENYCVRIYHDIPLCEVHSDVKSRMKVYRFWFRDHVNRLEQRNRKLRETPEKKIAQTLRNRLGQHMRNFKQNRAHGLSFVRDLGCTIKELMRYIEAQFQPGMSWDNYGIKGWHLDHIVPLAAFNLSDPVQFKEAAHYTNLQPMWAGENIGKNNRLNGERVTKFKPFGQIDNSV